VSTNRPSILPETHHVHEGPIERVRDEPVGWRCIDGEAFPIYVYGRRVYETWRTEDGEKWGRWNWRYV
jgi:hypothetical protein